MCNILPLSQIQVHLTQATSTILPKFDSIEIKIVYLKHTRDVSTMSTLALFKVSTLSLSPEEVRKTSTRQAGSGKV